MTLKDVAKAAGVSPSTVSRVIHSAGNNFASPEVRRRVWNAVRQLGYVPNQQAQGLKKGEAAAQAASTAPRSAMSACRKRKAAGAAEPARRPPPPPVSTSGTGA